ncbi:MAG: hypothetical protein V4760_00270 [Bdellovibrionota bacterium]
MLKNRIAVILVVASSLAVTSCGGESDLTAAGGTIESGALATVLAGTAFTDFKTSITPSGTGGLSIPVSGLPTGTGTLVALAPTGFEACTTTSGSATDGADADRVRAFYRQDLNCTDLVFHGGTNTFTGYYQEKDYDETKYGWAGGFLYDFDMTYKSVYSHETNEGRWKGLWSVVNTGTTITTIGEWFSEGGSTPTATPAQKSVWRSTNKSSTVLTPTNMATPWQAGSTVINGYFGVTGVIYNSTTSTSYGLDVVFKIESQNLTYDRTTCTTGHYKDGTLSFTDGGGNVLKYTWVSCTETRTFNGTTI